MLLIFANLKETFNVHVAGVGKDQTTNYTGSVVCPLINSVTYLDGTSCSWMFAIRSTHDPHSHDFLTTSKERHLFFYLSSAHAFSLDVSKLCCLVKFLIGHSSFKELVEETFDMSHPS